MGTLKRLTGLDYLFFHRYRMKIMMVFIALIVFSHSFFDLNELNVLERYISKTVTSEFNIEASFTADTIAIRRDQSIFYINPLDSQRI